MRILKWSGAIISILIIVLAMVLFQGDLPVDYVDAKYTSSASRFLTLPNGHRIHYRDEGLPAGEAVVLIHGAMASLHTWEPWVSRLGTQFRVVTLDLPGHGLTGAVPDNDYSTQAQINTIHALVNHLELSTFVLGGNSMGGGATWRYTLAHPERVSRMILLNAVGPWPRNDSSQDESRNSPFALLEYAWFRHIAAHINPKLLVRRGLLIAYNNSPVVNEQLVNRYNDLILRQGTRQAILVRRTRPRAQAADISELTQPTLILWGRHDALVPVAVGERLKSELPDAQLIIYPDLGHIPMEEAPDATSKDVPEFLSSSSRP